MRKILVYISCIICGIGIGTIIFLLISIASLPVNSPILLYLGIEKPRVIGFLPYFLTYRATSNYSSYLTTLDYFGLTIQGDGHLLKLFTPQQEDPGWYDLTTNATKKQLTDAKSNNETLSLTVVLEDEASISALLTSPVGSANNLLSDVVPVMKLHKFDDLNIDVESFIKPDAKKISAFTAFVTNIKNGLMEKYPATVSVDIAPIAFVKPNIVDPIAIGKIADFIVVMAYDYSNVVSSNVSPIAPLHGIGTEREYDVATAISLAKKEINPQKIIFGIPLYGYQWDSLGNTPGSATIPNTGQTASNRRIETLFASTCVTCSLIRESLAVEPDFVWQENKGDSYYHQAMLFDNTALSARVKFVEKNNFAGVALWALGYEGNSLLQPLTLYREEVSFK